MLERATGCLETGSRCLLASRTLSYRSRRSLHSAFWIHGASTIHLPSWWLSLLQQQPEEIQGAPKPADTARKYLAAGLAHGHLLDFLYPSKTLTLIHKLVIRDAAQYTRRGRRQPKPAGLRPYSGSSAAEALATDTNHDHATDMVASMDTGDLTPVARVDVGTASQDRRVADAISLLKSRLGQAWETHRGLAERGVDLDQRNHQFQATMQESLESIHAIGRALLSIYASETLKRFHASSTQDRSPQDYRAAVISGVLSEELDMAVDMATEQWSRRGFEGIAALTPHLLQRQEWDRLLLVWQMYRSAGDSMNLDRFLGSFDELNVNELLVGARRLFVYLMHKKKGPDRDEQARELVAGLAKAAFSRRDADFSLIYHYRLFNLLQLSLQPIEELFYLAIDQLLLFQGTDALREAATRKAISIYALVRRSEKLMPRKGLMEALIARLCQHHWAELSEMILMDHARFYGRPSRKVLEMVWRHASSDGNEIFRNKLVTWYGPISTAERAVVRLNRELTFYFRRLEVDKLVQHFESARSGLDVTPNVHSWNIVLMVHARIPDTAGALHWYSKMLESGIVPNSLTYRTLANMYSAGGDVSEVQHLIDKSMDAGIKMHSSMIDSLVHALIKSQELDRAEMLVASAAHMELTGTRTRMWNYLLNGVALRGDLMRVKHLYDEMRAAGIAPDEMTYAALMLCLCVRGLPKYAYSVLRKVMPTQNRVRILPIHFAIVMGGFVTKEMYGEVFNAYQFMITLGIRPSWSAQTTFLKAVANHERQRLEKSGVEPGAIYLQQAEILLDDLLSNLDAMDLRTQEPLRGVNDQRLDDAYLANYFEFLMFSYGRSGNMARVSALFDHYLSLAQARNPGKKVSPPMKIIVALMGSLLKHNLHENIRQLWELAVAKARPLAFPPTPFSAPPPPAPSPPEKDSDLQPSIFPGRRFILTSPLIYYIQSLTAQSRYDDITALITQLQQEGYAMANSIWNLYVEALLSAERYEQAFTVAEAELMSGWRGWPVRGGFAAAIKVDLDRQLPTRIYAKKRMPSYLVLVRLAAAYMDVRRRSAFQTDPTTPLEALGRIAPTVVRAVTMMPRMDDEVQAKYLRRW